jgi:hypothetical protein
MREFHVEIGTEAADGTYTRLHSEPLLARNNAEAILIADELVRKAKDRHRASMALLIDERTAVVRAWPLNAWT